MNKLIVALIAGTFAAIAGAQTPAATPDVKAKQEMVNSTTKAATEEHSGAAMAKHAEKTAKHHKKHKKTTAKAKQETVKAATEAASNEHTSATTAAMAAKNSAASKADNAMMNKPPQMGTPAADSAMQKASKP